MRRLLVPSAVLLIAGYGVTAAVGDLESGLQVGAKVGPYNVYDVTGPNAGKKLCYR